MKHLCIVFAYLNIDHIKISFDSFYNENIDFFIVENKSENSELIKNYFLTKKLIGYIQFTENIAANAINIFIEKYYDLMLKYDIITFTDCDLYVYNNKSMFEEILNNLDVENVVISSANLYRDNYYLLKNKDIGVDSYIKKMKNRNVENNYIILHTGIYFMTLKKDNLFILKDIIFLDSMIKRKIEKLNKLWVSTKNNIIYHLTWDLYVDGNSYYEFKKNNLIIWRQYSVSDYLIIK